MSKDPANITLPSEKTENIIHKSSVENQLLLFKSIVINMNEGVLISEANTSDRSEPKIIYINNAYTKITGYSLEELAGQSLQILRGPKTDPETVKKIDNAFFKGLPLQAEIVNYRKDGAEYWIELNSVPVKDAKGFPIYWISIQRDITERKKAEEKIKRLYKRIRESINYAKRIQQSILPGMQLIRKSFPDSFILFKPKDVVSGDFTWFYKKNDDYFIAAVDCTGHGVPGAFMSIIGNDLLNEIVIDKNIDDPAKILGFLKEGVNRTLHQSELDTQSDDGLEIAFCRINLNKKQIVFSGSHRPLYFIHNGQLTQYKGDLVTIGGKSRLLQNKKASLNLTSEYNSDFSKFEIQNPKLEIRNSKSEIRNSKLEIRKLKGLKFSNHIIKFRKNDAIFLFSDGLQDQFSENGESKYGSKRLRENIVNNLHLTMDELYNLFNKDFEQWKGSSNQIDDVLLIGIRF
ncbi:MAG: PAS domain S-box protein [Cytophagales bacterium]|nr:PAS domain S-box protein [Cytophagales bacterium]